jgi:hypothetical protein
VDQVKIHKDDVVNLVVEAASQDIVEVQAGVNAVIHVDGTGNLMSVIDWVPSHLPEMSEVSKNISRWMVELDQEDPDRDFILRGIRDGFMITDRDLQIDSSVCTNYRSTSQFDTLKKVEETILKEVDLGRYIKCVNQPYIVSSLGAILKPNKSIRLIHDLSRPNGGVNRLAVDTSVCYSTLDEAVRMIKPGTFLAKLDLSSAYRSIPLHPDAFPLTGIQWTFSGDDKPTFMYDARLPFGAGMAWSIFQTLSYSVVRMMARRNFHVVSYIDDFLCVEDTEQRCFECHESLQELLSGLGYVVNKEKTESPNQVMSFLGVSIDCVERTLSLPEKKLKETKEMIARCSTRSKCTKK